MPLPPSADKAATSPRAKRSASVSLVLLVGAGAAAFALARHDPSQREEDTLIYADDAECVAQGLRPADECAAEYRTALASYAAGAPRYETAAECERHHGPGGCTTAGPGTPGGPGAFVPVMAGYMIGRTAAQGLPVQPLYRHAPEERTASGGIGAGGYCTGAGGRVSAPRGGNLARVSSAVARTTTAAPRMIAQGGFGGTGRAISSWGGRLGGSGGG